MLKKIIGKNTQILGFCGTMSPTAGTVPGGEGAAHLRQLGNDPEVAHEGVARVVRGTGREGTGAEYAGQCVPEKCEQKIDIKTYSKNFGQILVSNFLLLKITIFIFLETYWPKILASITTTFWTNKKENKRMLKTKFRIIGKNQHLRDQMFHKLYFFGN